MVSGYGPTFLVSSLGNLGGVASRFNAWGGKHARYRNDAEVSGKLLNYLEVESFKTSLVCEGGALSVDGEGTVLTTESALLNRNRNPDLGRTEVESKLCELLGCQKVIWLPGSGNDEVTDGHVDGIATFVRPATVLVELAIEKDDPEYAALRENLRVLEHAVDSKGRKFEVAVIYRPRFQSSWSRDFAASYVNFYVANSAVIMPKFGDKRADAAGHETVSRLFPDREVVQNDISPIATHGGGIHCVTQQEPKPRCSFRGTSVSPVSP
jgi:agmatine deiminase